jgi:YfiH family protein
LEEKDVCQPQGPKEVPDGYDALAARGTQTLMVRLADCQGIIIYDPASRTVALVHSGWRGSVQNIAGKTVLALAEKYSLNPGTFVAAVSPSLGPCCAEFIHYRDELPESFWEYKDEKDRFDFPAITKSQLVGAGLKPNNIELSGICTKCGPDFYSYRRKETGRFAVLAAVTGNNP